ncbi:ArsR/SmtB family transcription factor [Amycolatopsis vastitatis]|uniref:ArsR family transcriptional regulator n=1 Tax=Amycolatopsis vastitatis TaxID=1905142 RepID=A0A229TA48_9PSEU|nr:helix-turn-helix transcriptional regulator [Amycolatopsis vastitatis]OXM67880.1 ArsR family transcriptional regulator [Amycolatopsis vastitatis]
MSAEPDIASVAHAIGEPARAAMLLQLMDGDAHTARALAAVAGIAPSTASSHLRRLSEAGLVEVAEAGRRRLHRLAGPEVAQLVEALAALAPPRLPERLQPDRRAGPLLHARACYGHLAGQLGIDFAAALREDGVVGDLTPGETGVLHTFDHPLLAALGIGELPDTGPAVRGCLDWSHGTVHLAGALGTALLRALLGAGWVRRRSGGRALRITEAGRHRLGELGLV